LHQQTGQIAFCRQHQGLWCIRALTGCCLQLFYLEPSLHSSRADGVGPVLYELNQSDDDVDVHMEVELQSYVIN